MYRSALQQKVLNCKHKSTLLNKRRLHLQTCCVANHYLINANYVIRNFLTPKPLHIINPGNANELVYLVCCNLVDLV